MLNRLLSILLLGCALSAWGAGPAQAQTGAPAFELNVERVDGAEGGKVYRIASNGTVAAPPAVVWRILTDYKRLAEYVPDLNSVRVVSRDGDKVIIEQVGAARFLFFSQAIRLVVLVHEQAPDRIDISLVDGDLKIYRASWELSPLPAGAGTRVVYKAAIAPKFYVPALIGESVVKQDIARMMAAVLLRLDRAE